MRDRGRVHSPTFRLAARSHFDRLNDRVREIVEAASAIGRRFDVDLLSIILEHDTHTIVSALRVARDEGVVDESDEQPDVFLFRHELLRRAVYDRMLTLERQTLHRRIAAALHHANAADDLLATHLLAAGDLAGGAVSAEAAGDRAAAIDATASARDRYLDAERTGILVGDDRARLQEKLGRAFDNLGDAENAALRLSSAAQHHETVGSDDISARLWLRYAHVIHRSRHTTEALSAVRHALDLERSVETQFAARAAAAWMLAFEDDAAAAQEQIDAAHSLPCQGSAAERVSLDYAKLAIARYEPTRAWLDAANSAVANAQEVGDAGLIAHAMINAGIVARERGETELGISSLVAAAERAHRSGRILAEGLALSALTGAYSFAGKLDAAYHTLLTASGLHIEALQFRFDLAEVAIPVLGHLGELSNFPQFTDPSVLDEARSSGDTSALISVTAAQLFGAGLADLPYDDRAIETALGFDRWPLKLDAALLAFALFAPARHVERIGVLATTAPPRFEQARVYWRATRAALDIRSKNRASSESLALAVDEARDAPLIAGLIFELSGRTRDAERVFAETGARGSLARVRRRTMTPLTPREREIANHVVAGRTNREMAATLMLSERTVEHHVAAIFRKLDITGRDQIATKLES